MSGFVPLAHADRPLPGTNDRVALGQQPEKSAQACSTIKKQQLKYWNQEIGVARASRDLRQKWKKKMINLAKAIRATKPNIVTEFLEGRMAPEALKAKVSEMAVAAGFPVPAPLQCPMGYALGQKPNESAFCRKTTDSEYTSLPISGGNWTITADLPSGNRNDNNRRFQFSFCDHKGKNPDPGQKVNDVAIGCLEFGDYLPWEPEDATYTKYRMLTAQEKADYGKRGGPQLSDGQGKWEEHINWLADFKAVVSDPPPVYGETFSQFDEYLCANRNFTIRAACPDSSMHAICPKATLDRIARAREAERKRMGGMDAGVASDNEGCRGNNCSKEDQEAGAASAF